MGGLDKLIDFLLNQLHSLLPFRFIYQNHNGVQYRAGRFIKVCKPGFRWKIPWIEEILTEYVTDTTLLLPTQTIPCKDSELVIRGCVGYKITDVGDYFNNVSDTKSAISDNAYKIIRHTLSDLNYEEIKKSEFIQEDVAYDIEIILKSLLQEEIKHYGVTINFVSLVEISKTRSYKIWNENIRLES